MLSDHLESARSDSIRLTGAASVRRCCGGVAFGDRCFTCTDDGQRVEYRYLEEYDKGGDVIATDLSVRGGGSDEFDQREDYTGGSMTTLASKSTETNPMDMALTSREKRETMWRQRRGEWDA